MKHQQEGLKASMVATESYLHMIQRALDARVDLHKEYAPSFFPPLPADSMTLFCLHSLDMQVQLMTEKYQRVTTEAISRKHVFQEMV